MHPDPRPDSWTALLQTAHVVRAGRDDAPAAELHRWLRLLRPFGAGLVVGAAMVLAVLQLARTPATAAADSGADSTLFSLTNSDRSSNGVASLSFNGTLETIGEGGYYGGCGFAVDGRSVDMIQRDYFAHPIKNCGQIGRAHV